MSNHVLLDNVTHKDIKVRLERGVELGDNMGYAVIVPREFRQVIASYPIVFRKNNGGQFEAVALFGFHERENLFLRGNVWDADYLPLSVRRIPFMIGYSYDQEQGARQPVVHIDVGHPRVSQEMGVPVFLEHGGISPYLQEINSVLGELLNGVDDSSRFIKALAATNLLEPFTLNIKLESGQSIAVKGFYTISEEKLRELPDTDILAFHKNNYFELIYEAIASLSNLRALIKRKEAQIAGITN